MSETQIKGTITELNLDDIAKVFGLEVAEAVRQGKAKTFLDILVCLGQFSQVCS